MRIVRSGRSTTATMFLSWCPGGTAHRSRGLRRRRRHGVRLRDLGAVYSVNISLVNYVLPDGVLYGPVDAGVLGGFAGLAGAAGLAEFEGEVGGEAQQHADVD